MKNLKIVSIILFAAISLTACKKITGISSLIPPPSIPHVGPGVYVGGYDGSGFDAAKYWHNDTAVTLSGGIGGTVASIFSIAISGTDLYAAAGDGDGGAKYWKGAAEVDLTNGTKYGKATAIVVSGSDVYVAGYEEDVNGTYSVAKYWKNGNAINLSDTNGHAEATAIAVVGNDVYVAGYEKPYNTSYYVAKYWRMEYQ